MSAIRKNPHIDINNAREQERQATEAQKPRSTPLYLPAQQTSDSGAAGALRWISEREADSRKEVERLEKLLSNAINKQAARPPEKDGTDFDKAVKVAQSNLDYAIEQHFKWLRQLRDFDKTVAPEKRDASESITRNEGAKMLTMFAIYMRTATESLITSLSQDLIACRTPEEAYKLGSAKVRDCFVNSIQSAIRESHLPAWTKTAIEEAM